MTTQQEISAVQRVYDHFSKSRYKSFLKASDFYVPFFFGKKKRLADFSKEYAPFAAACFTETLRNQTAKDSGEPNEELISAFVNKYVPEALKPAYDEYWTLICTEVDKNPEDARQIVSGLSTLFMYKLFGPNAEQPDPDILNSHRHQVAMDFQVGSLMFEFTHGIKVVLEKEKKKK